MRPRRVEGLRTTNGPRSAPPGRRRCVIHLLADGAASRSMVLNDTGCAEYARAAARALLDAAIPAEAESRPR
ncbi:hypothetical protein DMB37_38585 [Nocardia sp. CS682]|nr:hypothetical protein DMB37_38585 [Nocardia sp. CS682]